MKKFITTNAIGKYPKINITEEEYVNLKDARMKLIDSLSIAEKFEILLQNFLELEKELLKISSDLMLKSEEGYEYAFESRLKLNRRILNLLTSTRLYVDQTTKHIYSFWEKSSGIKREIKSYFEYEYDSSFYYRFMEALRNYVQHKGLAIHNMKNPYRWIPEKESKLLEIKTEVYAIKSHFEENGGFKIQVLEEMSESLNLNIAAREYVGCFNRIHEKIQKLILKKTNESRKLIQGFIDQYKALNSGKALGLYVFSTDKDEIIEKFSLLLEWDDIRLKLNKKHSKLGKIEKMYVSGK